MTSAFIKGERPVPIYDFDPEKLKTYRSAVAVPADFDAFWSETLAETRAFLEAPEKWTASHGGRPATARQTLGR